MTISIRARTGRDVFDEAYERLRELYADGHTVVVAFSAGKDSGVCLELAIMAARDTGRLPVHVSMRDEEIMLPGTFEYAERTAVRPEVDFADVAGRLPAVSPEIGERVAIEVKYQGYVRRQEMEIERAGREEHLEIPERIEFVKLDALSR